MRCFFLVCRDFLIFFGGWFFCESVSIEGEKYYERATVPLVLATKEKPNTKEKKMRFSTGNREDRVMRVEAGQHTLTAKSAETESKGVTIVGSNKKTDVRAMLEECSEGCTVYIPRIRIGFLYWKP